MKIIAHRGMWYEPSEQNTRGAFERAFMAGFGIKFDVRDHRQELVISNDMPSGAPLLVAEVLEMHQSLAPHVPLAINIKADGLVSPLKALLAQYETTDYFLFDMSVSDMQTYLSAGITCLACHSEFEPATALYEQVQGYGLTVLHGACPKSA